MNVHIRYCCVLHGCRYHKSDCPVTTGEKQQQLPCEACFTEGIVTVEQVKQRHKFNTGHNVLICIITEGENPLSKCALINSSLLEDYDLDELNGKILNKDDMEEKLADQIENLYRRLGLESGLEENKQDLKQCLNITPPFTVDKFILTGWST